MTKKIDETLKKTGIEKKKTNLRIERKHPSKTTKKVILETPILEQIPEKKIKRTISRKKPEPKAKGSLNAVQNSNITSQTPKNEKQNLKNTVKTLNIKNIENANSNISTPTVKTEKEPAAQKVKSNKTKKSNTTLKPNIPMPNSKKNSSILENKQILVKPKRTLRLKLESKNKITEKEEKKINSIIGFDDIPIIEASPIPKKEISINQNASFFYEPSIFEKFNIPFSNIDEDSSNKVLENPTKTTNENIILENDIKTEEENISAKNNSEVSADNTVEDVAIENNSEAGTGNTAEDVAMENNLEAGADNTAEDVAIENNFEAGTGNTAEDVAMENNLEAGADNTAEDVAIENNSEDVVDNTVENISMENNSEADAEIEEEANISSEDLEADLINTLLDEIIEEKLAEVEKENSEESDFDFVSNEIPEELKETFEKNLEISAKKQQFMEEDSNEYDFISTETPDIYKPYFSSPEDSGISEELDIDNSENSKPIEVSDSISDISITDDDISDSYFDTDNNTNTTETTEIQDISTLENDNLLEVDFTQNEIAKNEVADNLISDELLKETHKEASDTAIGKFFDSSIPAISQANDPSYFTKIKKSLFSNISTVFKKFSYEEASLLNSEKETFEEISPVIELGKSPSTDEVKKVLDNFDNTTNTNNVEVSASQNTLILPAVDEKILEAKEIDHETTNIEEPFTNIVTPPTTADNDLSLEDINLEDIDINDLELSDIEDILENQHVENTLENDTNLEDDLDNNQNVDDNTNFENILNSNVTDSISFEESEELEDDFEDLDDEAIDEELNEVLGIEPENSEDEDDENFSIEEYFGVTPKEIEEDYEDDFEEDFLDEEDDISTLSEEEQPNLYQDQINSFSKLIENFSQTISNLSDKITELENNISNNDSSSKDANLDETTDTEIIDANVDEIVDTEVIDTNVDEAINTEIINTNVDKVVDAGIINTNVDNITETEDTPLDNISSDEPELDDISIEDISIDDISLDDITLEDLQALEESGAEDSEDEDAEEDTLLPVQEEIPEAADSVEDILLKAFDNPNIDEKMKNDLLSEVLSVEENLTDETPSETTNMESVASENTSDFFKIIDSLSKTISELEKASDIPEKNSNIIEEPATTVEEVTSPIEEISPEEIALAEEVTPIATAEEIAPIPENTSDKAINILINKDDIFSIAILNETYEIVTDFDGISVISENIHISTPKNNFYVNIGDKYIEIHKQPDLFVVNTNFEDIEFANAINNVTFAKKKNKIELNIKAAFKISSVNKKIELSMLNTSIANLTSTQETSDDNSSICDNKTLVINEETQKVYLPYTIEEVMKKLNNSSDYQSIEDVIEQEYTLPLSTFKMPIISRFKEAYRFMRTKEKSSVYAALDLAVELMFNSNLNPAIIRASKDLKELNIYLDCLYENELDKFDCFKVIYKVLPKIQ